MLDMNKPYKVTNLLSEREEILNKVQDILDKYIKEAQDNNKPCIIESARRLLEYIKIQDLSWGLPDIYLMGGGYFSAYWKSPDYEGMTIGIPFLTYTNTLHVTRAIVTEDALND